MRVLQLGPYPPPHGGVQTNLVAIRELLLRRGHECAVINLHRHRTGRGEGVYHPTGAAQTLALILRLKYDIIHLHLGGDVTPRLVGLAAVCTSMPRAGSVLSFHSGGYATSAEGRSASPRTVRGFVFRRFDRVIAVNAEIAELFLRFGVARDRVRLIYPHALPAELPEAELPRELREFFCAHKPAMITVGLLEPEYDLGLQIETLGRIREWRPGAGLAIVGSGSLDGALRERIAAQPWAEHILLCGDVPHAATLRAIAAADVFLRTTRYDGDSVAVREALHVGTPVVATDNGMRPEGVVLMRSSDAGGLCGAVEEALARSRAARRGVGGDENIEAVLAVYEEVMKKREARSEKREE